MRLLLKTTWTGTRVSGIHEQMKLVSDNVRNYTKTPASDPSPFGSAWDVLWLGHCGEMTEPDTERLEYYDDSLMATEDYAGFSKKFLVAQDHRSVQKLAMTMCTFSCGISRRGARSILKTLSSGQDEALT
ncbi:hypothetical protein Z517_08083 [Fonsecaea pedrosoi CBS 271.37]|uniref:Uncharacterized protein n=1 Tax=Fonsecaea pedrosoi CBS 271.37 TaxID=1442368 RepID=A0A0D2H0N9_9EURO|nr:uncharacterized protein Z517_08083 [Fonsecaea pedrosoi CBS 271.37]KIW78249.1 hypothetical protein Z517_08083 [Fonsecaea pedrosoi CBS 271.37]